MNNTTQKIRATRAAIFSQVFKSGKTSIRKLADIIKGSKSSVHRHLQAQSQRNQYPESLFWETEAGSA